MASSPRKSPSEDASDMDSWLAGFSENDSNKPDAAAESTAEGSVTTPAIDLLSDHGSLESDQEEAAPADDLFASMPPLSEDERKKNKKEKKKRKSEKAKQDGEAVEKKRKDDEVAQLLEQLESAEDICEMCAGKSSQACAVLILNLHFESSMFFSFPRSKASV